MAHKMQLSQVGAVKSMAPPATQHHPPCCSSSNRERRKYKGTKQLFGVKYKIRTKDGLLLFTPSSQYSYPVHSTFKTLSHLGK